MRYWLGKKSVHASEMILYESGPLEVSDDKPTIGG